MVGKGRRRREKNYKAAHGGPARLPPPPDPSQVEALPSKLRKIMSFTSASNQGSMKISKENGKKRKRTDPDSEKRRRTDREIKVEAKELEDDGDNGVPAPSQQTDSEVEIEQNRQSEKRKKKKRKRKQVTDLRFQEEILGTGSKRRERKKKYLEAKKKKHKKAKTEENMDFPGREQVKFGEVVEAPPKLVAVPKAFKMKTAQDASKERLRLQAIEAYRNRKGWTSRPGAVELPPTLAS
ncbi:hypothetical protein SLE2022_026930 [Rubroshorea leprosula]